MSQVEIRDHALWVKHIHGNEPLKQRILDMAAGETIKLAVNGSHGVWRKMDDGADGRPTAGLRALGRARDHWFTLQDQRGELVPIKEMK